MYLQYQWSDLTIENDKNVKNHNNESNNSESIFEKDINLKLNNNTNLNCKDNNSVNKKEVLEIFHEITNHRKPTIITIELFGRELTLNNVCNDCLQ